MDPAPPSSRTLFESSLELKCLFFFGLALTIVIAVSFYLYWRVTAAQLKVQNPRAANLLVGQEMVLKHWKLWNRTKEKSFESPEAGSQHDPIEDDFNQMMELITKGLREEKFKSRVIRSQYYTNYFLPGNPDDFLPRNAYEENLLSTFAKAKPNAQNLFENDYRDKMDDQTGEYHYYRAIRVNSKRCTDACHRPINDDDPLIGDLIGIMHVTIPKPPARDAIAKYWAILLGISIITAFLSLIAFYIVIRMVIIRPLRNLKDVAEGISRGDISKRADLHTGDEFESLGITFNRMLRHLVAAQEKLRGANNELEYKVDELAHLTVQLYETNRVKSDFMATMSHELRTPLNSILGFSDVLGSINTLDEKQKRYVDNINKSGKSLLNMINDILDMAKIEAGRMDVQLNTFQIGQVVAVQSDMAKPLLDKKNIDLEIRIDPKLPPLRQDESRIQQILNNLLSNAIKFTPEGGRIKIAVFREERAPFVAPLPDPSGGMASRITVMHKHIPFLVLEVSDTGVGISEEDQQIVFEKFRQAKRSMSDGDTMKREYSGSGLGLSIVKELCRMLEGEIFLDSQLGLGSTFTVLLPWMLEPRSRSESEMMAEIQQFTRKAGQRIEERG